MPFEKYYACRLRHFIGKGKDKMQILGITNQELHNGFFPNTLFLEEAVVSYITHIKFEGNVCVFEMFIGKDENSRTRCHTDLVASTMQWIDVTDAKSFGSVKYHHWSKDELNPVYLFVDVRPDTTWEAFVRPVVVKRNLVHRVPLLVDEVCLGMPDVGQRILKMLEKRSLSAVMCTSKMHYSYGCRVLQSLVQRNGPGYNLSYASNVVFEYYERLVCGTINCTGLNCKFLQYRCALCHPMNVKNGTGLLNELRQTMNLWLFATQLSDVSSEPELTIAEICSYLAEVSHTNSYNDELHYAVGIIRNAEDNETYTLMWKKILRLWVCCLRNYDEQMFKQKSPRSILAKKWIAFIEKKYRGRENT